MEPPLDSDTMSQIHCDRIRLPAEITAELSLGALASTEAVGAVGAAGTQVRVGLEDVMVEHRTSENPQEVEYVPLPRYTP